MTIFARLLAAWNRWRASRRIEFKDVLHPCAPIPDVVVRYRRALLSSHHRLYILHNRYDCWVITGYDREGRSFGGCGYGSSAQEAIQGFLVANRLNRTAGQNTICRRVLRKELVPEHVIALICLDLK